jgi:hypothetical protein
MTKEEYRDFCILLAEKNFNLVSEQYIWNWLLLWAAWEDL